MTSTGSVPPEPPADPDRGDVPRLPCGADPDLLFEQAADGRAEQLTEHQQDCEYCQAALSEFAGLWAPVARAAAVPLAVPAGLASALTAGVMAGVHGSTVAGGGSLPAAHPVRIFHLGRWLSVAAATAVVAAIIVAIVLAGGHHHSRSPLPAPRSPVSSAAASTPPRTPPPSPRRAKAGPVAVTPTAVPAGSGGRAAPTPAGTRAAQFLLLAGGLALMAAGSFLLIRLRRLRR